MNLNSISDIDIICFSLSRWKAPISSPAVSLAKELSKNNRVFYIEHPYSVKDVFTDRHLPLQKPYTEGNVTIITPPVTLPVNFLPQGVLYNSLNEFNNSILLKTLRLVIREIGIKKYLFINFFDPFFLRTIPSDIRPLKFVYQCMDDISQVAYTSKHGLRLEHEIIRNADITICTSKELTRIKSAISPNVYFLPNAADTELFKTAFTRQHVRPLELGVGKKVIGFMGSIEYRTDFELLRKLALHHTDKILFMLGPVNTDEHIKMGIDKLPNVVFAGSRKLADLPEYLQFFDCCIIPYRLTTLTSSIYPLKINEYLAAGKPVVATAFSEDIQSFGEVAYIAQNHDDFIQKVDLAIEEDDQNKKYQRLNRASQNSWANRVNELWEIVLRHSS